jgi:hypothetical protein
VNTEFRAQELSARREVAHFVTGAIDLFWREERSCWLLKPGTRQLRLPRLLFSHSSGSARALKSVSPTRPSPRNKRMHQVREGNQFARGSVHQIGPTLRGTQAAAKA